MIDLGRKDELFHEEMLQPLDISGRPVELPPIHKKHYIVCGYNKGLGEYVVACESLQDMQDIYDILTKDSTTEIKWYFAPEDIGNTTVLG